MALVLVADDNERIREVISRVLQRNGHTVIPAVDGEAAWETVRERKPDLVIIDGVMPGTSGFEVCERIHADTATTHIPVIVVSGWLPAGSEASCATATLAKPFMPNELTEQVEQVLQARAKPAA
ncbi:response regulator [Planosporangium thailandense]|uniref:Response regulator n=1 Tax=Planosporangium thailandense TaxID=765197 RepID=A0ABX0XZ70_9ACTN|nr:response regulator [Planosporangium thailandense]NJC70505.1 response regulator [Planosporangium thailandense]